MRCCCYNHVNGLCYPAQAEFSVLGGLAIGPQGCHAFLAPQSPPLHVTQDILEHHFFYREGEEVMSQCIAQPSFVFLHSPYTGVRIRTR